MRTFLKLFVTLAVLGGAFVAYLVWQPSKAVQQAATRPAIQQLKRNPNGMLIGEGENAWVRQFDDEGRLASRFRAARWEPQKNGLVRVIRPEAELFGKAGKDKDGKEKPRPLIRIRGDDGEVVVASLPEAAATDKPLASSQGGGPAAGGKGGSVGPAQPPSSGRLNGVLIEVFEAENDPAPRVTLTTNNIVFDNDTFRLSTESYRATDGSTVAPDQVEVAVTGPDFEFYGRGLTVRWNDLEERLDLLRIAHGDRLVIKNMEAFSNSGLPLSAPAPKAPETPTAAVGATATPAWGMLASADPGAALALAAADRRPRGAAAVVTTPASKPAKKKPKNPDGKDHDQPPYRAAFHDDVRVVEGERQVATARLLNIDFLPGERRRDSATTKPASTHASADAPTTAPGASDAVATQPASAGAGAGAGAADTATAASQPATAPAAEPITVYWTGELTVTPSPLPADPTGPGTAPAASPAPVATAAGDEPLPPGEARVELIGAPAVLTRDPLDVKTARFVFRTDGRMAMDGSPEFPRVLITQRPESGDGPPTAISTEGVTYSRGHQVATLRGESRILSPLGGAGADDDAAAAPAPAPAMLDASWHETATFKLVGESESDLWVEHAALAGKVNVRAPQGFVRSERLELAFDPPVAEPATTRPAATQPVTQPATRPAGDLAAPALARSAAGSTTPNLRRVVASEGVYCELTDAVEGTRKVECQQLSVETARSHSGELYPRLVDASGAVHAATAEQDLAAGHVVLHLRPATKVVTPEPAAGPAAPPATQPAFANKAQWALADAGAAGLARASRVKSETSPAIELESMTATDAVRVSAKDGGVATGKRLAVTLADDGTPRAELTGDPARVEHAGAGGTLTGPRIEVDPKTGVAHVVGPGTLRAVQRDERDGPAPVLADAVAAGIPAAVAPGRPIEVTWADGAEVRAADNRIDITGAVSLWLTDTDGSVRTANAGRVNVELASKPAGAASAPEAVPSVADGQKSAAASRPGPAVDMDLFKDKEVSTVHLLDNAVVNSRLAASDGSMLRQFHLKSQRITYDARSRRLAVPGPGQMLVEAHEPDGPAEPEPAGSAGDDPAANLGSGNGVTAFQWAQSLEYDQSAGRAVMDGSVLVSHQPDRKGDPAVRVDADSLTAMFEPRPGAAGEGEREGGKAGEAADENPAAKLQLKSMAARGNILISREGSELTAYEITFDPATGWVTARGSPRNPATYTAPGSAGTVRAGELQLNTETWQVKVKDVNTRVGGIAR